MSVKTRLRVVPQFPSRIVERNESVREYHPTWERLDAAGREKNSFLSLPRLAFLAWGDFYTRSRFARSTNEAQLVV